MNLDNLIDDLEKAVVDQIVSEFAWRVCLEATEQLYSGELGEALQQAHDAFENGTDIDERTAIRLDYALECRLLLEMRVRFLQLRAVRQQKLGREITGWTMEYLDLEERLHQVDTKYAKHNSVCYLDADKYEEQTAWFLFSHKDYAHWYGRREYLDTVLPVREIAATLKDMAKC